MAIAPNPVGFRSAYGNYYVSSITYRRRVRVRFISQISKQVSEQDIRLALKASYSCFSISTDMASLQIALSKLGNTSVEIDVEGMDGAQVISAAVGTDLLMLRVHREVCRSFAMPL